jgi:two-component system sensor histidine kinase GlrK
LAILPLLMGIFSAVTAVERLAVLSQQTVYHVAQQTRASRMLLEKLGELERRGKQFLVLEDLPSRNAYGESHAQFAEIVDNLRQAAGSERMSNALDGLVAEEVSVYEALVGKFDAAPANSVSDVKKPGKAGASIPVKASGVNQDALRQAAGAFQNLSSQARQVAQEYAEHVDKEAADLTQRSKDLQRQLLGQTGVLLPISVLMILFFIRVINRPIRLVDHAIRGLGVGKLDKPIKVTGSRDMEYLGERLEWLRTRLKDLEVVKQRFMRNVSHEIKTPLANLKEGTELLADEIVGKLSPEQREIAQILSSNIQKLESLIANLINYSQANASNGELKLELVDMRSLVLEVIEDQQLRLRGKSINVRTNMRLVQMYGYREQLRTIIDNLLSNAVKYSPVEGEIRVNLHVIGGHMELEVEDDGPGIDPGERSHVFEPFFQGRASREYGVSGTGLGLAIVGECVASHHGKVEALEPHTSGARIRVQIPVSREMK